MGWDIKVWHEDVEGEEVRLSIQAGSDIPDEVIGSLAGSYWLEEVQLGGEEWDEAAELQIGPENDGPRLQN